MDDALRRLERDVEDLATRVRQVENIDTPASRQVLSEFREVQRRLGEIERRGTAITTERMRELRKMVDANATRITKLEDARDEDVRRNFRVLIGAIVSIIVAVVSAILIGLATRPPT